VVNTGSQVVPPESVLAALAVAPGLSRHVLRYEGGHGAALEHLGPLVAPSARADLWPQILDWLCARWADRS
jgi:hypothetical protein